MSTPGPDKSERQARKEYVHDRTTLVMKSCFIGLAVALILGLLGAFGIWGKILDLHHSTEKNNYGVTAPCAPEGAVAIDPSKISVVILNGTNKTGLADAVSQALYYRGFNIDNIGNAAHTYAHTTILAGTNGLAEAYSLRKQFPYAVLQLDNSTNKVVYVVIGNDFYDLKPINSVTVKDGDKLTSISGCVASANIKNPQSVASLGTVENNAA